MTSRERAAGAGRRYAGAGADAGDPRSPRPGPHPRLGPRSPLPGRPRHSQVHPRAAWLWARGRQGARGGWRDLGDAGCAALRWRPVSLSPREGSRLACPSAGSHRVRRRPRGCGARVGAGVHGGVGARGGGRDFVLGSSAGQGRLPSLPLRPRGVRARCSGARGAGGLPSLTPAGSAEATRGRPRMGRVRRGPVRGWRGGAPWAPSPGSRQESVTFASIRP